MPDDLPIYRFEQFELNPAESVLLKSGVPQPITPKALSLLCLLAQNEGHVLEKGLLLDTIWKGSFVEEGNLAFNIRQLRKLLSDDARSPRFIETVPKRGYRFIAAVEKVNSGNRNSAERRSSMSQTVRFGPPSRSKLTWSSWLLAIPLILIAGGVLAVESWFGVLRTSPHLPQLFSNAFSSERLSTDGDVSLATISKNGNFMVYVAGNENEKQSLRIRDLATGQSREILEAADDQFFGVDLSVDDSHVYFVRNSVAKPNEACMFRMNLIGGVPEKLGCGMQGWFDISPDGFSMSFVRCSYQEKDYCSLYLADIDGQNERLMLTRSRPTRIADNAISPDGRSIAFASGQSTNGSDDFGIYILDFATGTERPGTDQRFFNVDGLDWVPGTDSIVATAVRSNDDSLSFWLIEPNTRASVPLKHDSENYKAVSFDGKGEKLISTTLRSDFRIYVHSLDGKSDPLALGKGWTPRFGPNGNLLFASDRSGRVSLWVAEPDGTNVKQLSSGPNDQSPISSPDGLSLYFASSRSNKFEVWTMQKDGSGTKQISSVEGGFPVGISKDGNWIYYLSALTQTLWKLSKDGTFEERVSARTFPNIELSPDARFAAFFEKIGSANQLSVISLEHDAIVSKIQLPGVNMEGKHLAWSANGVLIYAVLYDPHTKSNAVWRFGIDGSLSEKVSDLGVNELGERSGFAISPDERYFAIAFGEWKHDAVLVHGLK